jgi:sulfate transport system permease protein
MAFKKHSVLPGFGLTLGYTLLYLSLIVLIPLSALIFKTATLGWQSFWETISHPQAVASYKLTFGASLIAALFNTFFGMIVAWTLTRYTFPGKRILDAMIDLPFALPTAVSGIALTQLYVPSGWIGQWLDPILNVFGTKGAYTPFGVTIALVFIGLPFVVRTLQPSLEDLDPQIEEAAGSLGATRWQIFYRVIVPSLMPSILTGFALAFARAIGEYGSVIFIAGNLPYKTEIASFIIMSKLENHNYAGATAIAVVMLGASFLILLAINMIQLWNSRFK